MDRPIRVGITHGDINGVGYEVIFKTIGTEGITELFTPVVFGIPEIAEKAISDFGIDPVKLNVTDTAQDASDHKINIVRLQVVKPELHPGETRPDAGESAVEALEQAVEALKSGDIDLLVTAPISKEAVQSDKFNFPGHTEFLEERVGEGNEAMMILCNDSLRMALLTKHIPVSKIAENISEEKIIKAVETFAATLKKDYGIVRPSIAVLSLNPHAGDGGLLGEEEEKIIKPAIEKLVDKGYLTFGPFPADGFFGHGTYKKFDGILAMYHDQGLAPFKTLASGRGVNFTANLPYVRTSPDHGTAFDISWKGEADPQSFREAIYMAIDIFRNRAKFAEASANPLQRIVIAKSERHDRFPHKNELPPENDD